MAAAGAIRSGNHGYEEKTALFRVGAFALPDAAPGGGTGGI